MGLIMWLIVGGIVGWLASIIMKTNEQQGIVLNVAVGIAGSFLAGLVGARSINAGISILPRPTVLNESGMRTLAVTPLALPGLVRPIGIIHRRGRRLTPVVARFIAQLQKPVDPAS